MPPAASRRLPCRPVTTCDPARRRGLATRCRLVRACRLVRPCRPASPCRRAEPPRPRNLTSREAPRPGHAGPPRDSGLHRDVGLPRDGILARACRGRPWDLADRSARVVPCHLATPPTSLRRPGQGRAGPAPAPRRRSRAACGRSRLRRSGRPQARIPGAGGTCGTRTLRLLTSLTAGTPTSSARQITRSGRPAPCVRRASAGPRTRPGPQTPPGPLSRLAQACRPCQVLRGASDVYVYRDTGGQPDDPAAAAPGPDEHDASYWYDLPGTSGGGDTTPRVPQETRGPFEPLVSSADPPGTTPRFSASLDDAEPAAPEAAYSQEAPPAARRRVPGHGARPRAQARADQGPVPDRGSDWRGERRQALRPPPGPAARIDQRVLQAVERDQASGRRRGSGGSRAGRRGGPGGNEPGDAGDAGGPAGAPESARVTADQPRAW